MGPADAELLLDGLYFPESLRWRAGELWFSDIYGGQVVRIGPGGPQVVANVDGLPSGLGWLPDGTPLVVSCEQRRVLRIESDGTTTGHADLSGYLTHEANDMAVDHSGRAYVGNYGFDVATGAEPAPTVLLRVEPDGRVFAEEPQLIFPNGLVRTDGGRSLVVAETFADRLTTMRIAPDGSLHDPKVLATLPSGSGPDGIDVDEAGGIWVACAFGAAAVRVGPDGEATHRIEFPGEGVYCCALGGADRRTLFVALADQDEERAARVRTGRIVTVPVEVPA